VRAVEHLADPEFQQRVWVRRELPHPDYAGNFDLAVHILYDDTTVLEDPAGSIGDLLRDQAEAEAMAALGRALDAIFEDLGTTLSDAEYVSAPQWAAVVSAARAALDVLTAP
jgi:hypothetical protein